jgi:hypothetical protein
MIFAPRAERGRHGGIVANACPHCGKSIPARRLSVGAEVAMCLIAAGVLLSAANVASGGELFNSSVWTPRGTVSATELSRSYEANAAAADDRYKGHVFHVTGTVLSTSRNAMGDIVLELGDQTRFRPVTAIVHQSATHMAMRLSKGDSLGLNCLVKGASFRALTVDDCKF